MSRYIWKVSEVSYVQVQTLNNKADALRYVNKEDYIIVAKSITFNKENGTFTLTGDVVSYAVSDFSLKGVSYPYLATGTSSSQRIFYSAIFYSEKSTGYWRIDTIQGYIYCDNETYTYTRKFEAGDFVNYVSNYNFETYPSDDIYSGYYYKAFLADDIDPSAVTIPTSINGGESTQAVVTESVSGTLHSYGTIKYQYQYQINNGSWQDIKTSESASETFTVPSGANTLRVRVRVQDGLGYVQQTWIYSDTATVINNQPPSAPGNISVSDVHSGKQATITLTAATDQDGTVVNYIYERSADGGDWQVIATVNSLTQTDQVSVDWGTVAYRACAVDDDGAQGPYATTETFTVNKDYILISGPGSDIGTKNGPFGFYFVLGVSGDGGENVKEIFVSVYLDGESIYTGTKDSGQTVAVIIDTRFLITGTHNINVVAEKGGYMSANAAYVFDIDKIDTTLLASAKAGLMQNNKGEAKLPYTIAQLVIVDEIGTTLADVLNEIALEPTQTLQIASGTYTGTGTYGNAHKNRLQLEFTPKFLVVAPRTVTAPGISAEGSYNLSPNPFIVWSGQPGEARSEGNGYFQNANNSISVSETTIYWYSETSATFQLNARGTTYYYFAIGEASA